MPYRWTQLTPAEPPACWRLDLWPHRSLPRQGLVTFIGITAALLLIPLIATLGTPVLWALLPFLLGTLWLIWHFLNRNYADGDLRETLTISSDIITLTRQAPGAADQRWRASPNDVDVDIHRTGGSVENYVTLVGAGRRIEIGAFLSPDERLSLFRDLSDRVRSLDINARR